MTNRTAQTSWALCKWTQVGQSVREVPGTNSLEPPLICVRNPERPRPVTEIDCADCPHWEMSAEDDILSPWIR